MFHCWFIKCYNYLAYSRDLFPYKKKKNINLFLFSYSTYRYSIFLSLSLIYKNYTKIIMLISSPGWYREGKSPPSVLCYTGSSEWFCWMDSHHPHHRHSTSPTNLFSLTRWGPWHMFKDIRMSLAHCGKESKILMFLNESHIL